MHEVKGPEAIDASRIRAILALGGVPWDMLDDGVQQVRLILAEQMSRTDDSGQIRNPAAWAKVVASRLAIDWHREKTRESSLRHRVEEQWRTRSPGISDRDMDLALTVAGELDSMSAGQRQVLVLRYYEDWTVGDIARELEIPEGTVKSRLHAAVNVLRGRLEDSEVI